MKTYFPFERADGTRDMVAAEDIEAYRQSFPNAQQFRAFELPDGRGRTMVRQSDWDAFAGAEPDAKEYYFAETGKGERFEVAKDDFRAFLDAENPPAERTPVRDALAGAGEAALAGPRFAWGAAKGLAGAAAAPVAAIEGNAARANRAEAKDLRERADEIDGGGVPTRKLREAVRFKRDPRLYRTLTPEQREEVDRLAGIAEHGLQPTAGNRARAEALREEAARKEARAASQEGVKAALTPARGESRAERAGQTVGSFAAVPLEMAATGTVAGAALLGAEGAEAAASNLEARGMDPREAARRGAAVGAAETLPWLVPGAAQARTLAGRVARPAAEMAAKTVAGQELGRAATPAEYRPERDWGETALAAGGAALGGGILGAAGAIAEGRAQRRADAAQAARTVSVEVPGGRGPNGEAVYYNLAAARERPGEVVLQAAEMARRAREPDMAARKAEADAMREAVEPGPRAIPERGEPPAPPTIDAEGRVVAVDVGNRGRVVEGAPEAPALPPGEGTPPTVGGRPRVLVTPFEGPRASAEGAIALPDPALTPEQAALPTTPEQLDAARAAALAQRPLRERMRDTSLAAYQAEHPTPALEAIGADNFRALARKYKGDFRDVTGDPFDVLEVAQQAGRPDLAQDPQGAAKLLQMAADELAGYQDWKGRGAPTLEQESYGGAEIAANRAEQAEARERHAARLAAETEPMPPPEEQRALAAGADAAAEDAFVAEMERGEPAAPAQPDDGGLSRFDEEPWDAGWDAPTPQRRGALERGEPEARRATPEDMRAEFDVTSPRIAAEGDMWFGGREGTPNAGQDITIDGVRAGYVRRDEGHVGQVVAHAIDPTNHPDHYNRFVLVVNPADRNGNAIDFKKAVGVEAGLSFPNEDRWEIVFRDEKSMLDAFDKLQAQFGGDAFDFSEAGVQRWEALERSGGMDVPPEPTPQRRGALERAIENETPEETAQRQARETPRLGQDRQGNPINPDGSPQVKPEISKPDGWKGLLDAELKRRGLRDVGNNANVVFWDLARTAAALPPSHLSPEQAQLLLRALESSPDTLRFYRPPDVSRLVEDATNAENRATGLEQDRARAAAHAETTQPGAARSKMRAEKLARQIPEARRTAERFAKSAEDAEKAWLAELRRIAAPSPGRVLKPGDSVRFDMKSEAPAGFQWPAKPAEQPAQDAAALQAAFDQAYNRWAMAEQIVEGREMRGEDTTEAKARAAALYEQMAAAQRALAAAKQPAEPAPLVLDGGTPAELAAEKARAAQKAGIEKGLARELGGGPAPTIQEGLPGLGGDGTLFTPPPGGWGGGTGNTLADAPAAAPNVFADAPAGGGAAKPANDAPVRLKALLEEFPPDGTPLPPEAAERFEEVARAAERGSLYATAAKARQRAGTYEGTPWGSEGDVWPKAEPPLARATLGDLTRFATALGGGHAPDVVLRIARRKWAAGLFSGRVGPDGRPQGRIDLLSGLASVVDAAERQRILQRAFAEGAGDAARTTELAERYFTEAWKRNLKTGPKSAAAVLAHEIGHWIDFLPEGTFARGNVLGHLAALKKYMLRTLYPNPEAARDAGAAGLTPEERRQIEKDALKTFDGSLYDDKAARAKARAEHVRQAVEDAIDERGLARLGDVVAECKDLIAWFRQSDGMPGYFRKPAEMFAEAFSAWVNYPATAALKAPTFCELLDAWIDERPEAAEELRRFRDGVDARAAEAAAHAGPGGTPDLADPDFFAWRERRSQEARAVEQKLAELRKAAQVPVPRGRFELSQNVRAATMGPLQIIKNLLLADPGAVNKPENQPLLRALNQRDNVQNRMILWNHRFRTFVLPELEGVAYPKFLNYLQHYRIAHETFGPDNSGGSMNRMNPGGVTPGDVSEDWGNAATSSAAWLHAEARTEPEVAAALERARVKFWKYVRNGADLPDGMGSPMEVIRNSPCLSQAQKDALGGNEPYVAFHMLVMPDGSSPLTREQMSTWNGIFARRTGSLKEIGDVVANTMLQDWTMQEQLLDQEFRLRVVDWLRANKPEWVLGQAPVEFNPATGRQEVKQFRQGEWRVLPFLRDGKAEGWLVPEFIVEMCDTRARRSKASMSALEGFVRKMRSTQNAAMTQYNIRFMVVNDFFKDPSSLALRLPPKKLAGVGIAQGIARLLTNVAGDYPAMIGSWFDNTGRDFAKHKHNPDLARALASGALNRVFPGSTSFGAQGRTTAQELAAQLRELGLEGVDVNAVVREAGQMFGASEEVIGKALDDTESRLAEAAAKLSKAWDKSGGRLYEWLGRGEIRTKAYALRKILHDNPEMPLDAAALWVHDNIGTPALNNRPTIDETPWLGALGVPFFTPRIHGFVDQLVGGLRSGWGGGYGRRASYGLRFATFAVAMSIPSIMVVGLLRDLFAARQQRDAATTPEERERLDRDISRLETRARRWRAIPSYDQSTGICFPNPFVEKGHVKIAIDPTILPFVALAQGILFGGKQKIGDKEGKATNITRTGQFAAAFGDFIPSLAPTPTVALGLATGHDPNTGRTIGGGRDEASWWDRVRWGVDAATGRLYGTGLSEIPDWFSDDADKRERVRRPIISGLYAPFLRAGEPGIAEHARLIQAEARKEEEAERATADRIVRGKAPDESAIDSLYENRRNPDAAFDAARERLERAQNWTKDERILDTIPDLRRSRLEDEFFYIPPP